MRGRQVSTVSGSASNALSISTVSLLLFSMLLVGCGADPAAERPTTAENSTIVERSTTAEHSTTAEIPTTVERPDSVATASAPPGYIFKSLPRLMATSEIVVVGEVISAEKGERLVPDQPFYDRDVSVRVERQLYGPPVEDTIIVHVGGYSFGVSHELTYMPWLYPGDRAVYFLAPGSGNPSGHYEIVGAPGRLAIEDDGTVSTEAGDPIARRLDGQQWSVVAPRISSAAQTVRRQDIEPLPPDPFDQG